MTDQANKNIVYPESTIIREKIHNPKRLDPRDVPNVYRSMDEVLAAKRRGDFDISKTFHVAKNGKIYCLSFGSPHVNNNRRTQITRPMQEQYGNKQ